jgi:ATP synthase protein I
MRMHFCGMAISGRAAVRLQIETMPTPNPAPRPGKSSDGLNTLVKAERLMQIALVLPVSVVIGWGGGVLLDKWLHQHWIYIVGILFGAAAGLIEAVRESLKASN